MTATKYLSDISGKLLAKAQLCAEIDQGVELFDIIFLFFKSIQDFCCNPLNEDV